MIPNLQLVIGGELCTQLVQRYSRFDPDAIVQAGGPMCTISAPIVFTFAASNIRNGYVSSYYRITCFPSSGEDNFGSVKKVDFFLGRSSEPGVVYVVSVLDMFYTPIEM